MKKLFSLFLCLLLIFTFILQPVGKSRAEGSDVFSACGNWLKNTLSEADSYKTEWTLSKADGTVLGSVVTEPTQNSLYCTLDISGVQLSLCPLADGLFLELYGQQYFVSWKDLISGVNDASADPNGTPETLYSYAQGLFDYCVQCGAVSLSLYDGLSDCGAAMRFTLSGQQIRNAIRDYLLYLNIDELEKLWPDYLDIVGITLSDCCDFLTGIIPEDLYISADFIKHGDTASADVRISKNRAAFPIPFDSDTDEYDYNYTKPEYEDDWLPWRGEHRISFDMVRKNDEILVDGEYEYNCGLVDYDYVADETRVPFSITIPTNFSNSGSRLSLSAEVYYGYDTYEDEQKKISDIALDVQNNGSVVDVEAKWNAWTEDWKNDETVRSRVSLQGNVICGDTADFAFTGEIRLSRLLNETLEKIFNIYEYLTFPFRLSGRVSPSEVRLSYRNTKTSSRGYADFCLQKDDESGYTVLLNGKLFSNHFLFSAGLGREPWLKGYASYHRSNDNGDNQGGIDIDFSQNQAMNAWFNGQQLFALTVTESENSKRLVFEGADGESGITVESTFDDRTLTRQLTLSSDLDVFRIRFTPCELRPEPDVSALPSLDGFTDILSTLLNGR